MQPMQISRRQEKILVLDDSGRYLETVKRRLSGGGFEQVFVALDAESAWQLLLTVRPNVALIDIHLGENEEDGLCLVRRIVKAELSTLPVVVSSDKSREQLFKAARAGAVDFLVKGPHLRIGTEVGKLLDGKRGALEERTRPDIISDLGYLRSFGLTPKEIGVLTEFSRDFPKIKELAYRIDQAQVQLRKIFSRIYKKLEAENIGQVAHILTICEMFDREA